MRRPSRRLILSLAVIGACGRLPAILVGSERAQAPPLIVVVHDRAQILPEILDRAVKEAARIYRHAGVSTDWEVSAVRASGSVVDASRPSPSGFTIQLIIQASVRASSDRRSTRLMGAAATTRDCGGTTNVFHDQVARFATEQRLSSALVLGTVMAHEIGHLLLPHQDHSTEGLMRAAWDANDWRRARAGFLLFSSDHIASIRAALLSCHP